MFLFLFPGWVKGHLNWQREEVFGEEEENYTLHIALSSCFSIPAGVEANIVSQRIQ